jgi:hypothetical protein
MSKEITVATESIDEKEMEEFKKQISDTIGLIGGLIFFPFIFALSLSYGLRAGIVETLRKTLRYYSNFHRR